jgi:hypothetical protein
MDMEHVFPKRHLNAWSLQNLLENNLSCPPPSLLSIIPSQLNPTLTPRSGIGLSTAHYLLSRSHKLVLISRTHSALDALHYQYGSEQVEVLAGDMSDFSLGKKAVDLALSRWGRLDGVVCNHGGLEPVKKVADSTPEEWREAFGGNVFGVVGLVSLDTFFTSNSRVYGWWLCMTLTWVSRHYGLGRPRSTEVLGISKLTDTTLFY